MSDKNVDNLDLPVVDDRSTRESRNPSPVLELNRPNVSSGSLPDAKQDRSFSPHISHLYSKPPAHGVGHSSVPPPPSFSRLVSTPSYSARERRGFIEDNVVDWKSLRESARVHRPSACASSSPPHLIAAAFWRLNGHLYSFLADEFASLVFVSRLFTSDPWSFLFTAFLSAASPCFFYYLKFSSDIDDTHEDKRLSFNLSWALLSTAVVFPLTMTLSETFKRRENALCQIAALKANVTCYYMAHEDWGKII
jgi:hypothetical protein